MLRNIGILLLLFIIVTIGFVVLALNPHQMYQCGVFHNAPEIGIGLSPYWKDQHFELRDQAGVTELNTTSDTAQTNTKSKIASFMMRLLQALQAALT